MNLKNGVDNLKCEVAHLRFTWQYKVNCYNQVLFGIFKKSVSSL